MTEVQCEKTTSQLPIAHWHAYLGEDPTVADALLDRLLSAAHRLELKGESLRKRQKQNGKELDAEAPNSKNTHWRQAPRSAHDAPESVLTFRPESLLTITGIRTDAERAGPTTL